MKYKEMVLLEDLVEHCSPEHDYKISFILDNKTLCIGDFRKRKTKQSVSTDDYSVIHSEKLLNDYMNFVYNNEQIKKYAVDLFAYFEEYVDDYQKEKFENHLLASMTAFLTDEETNPNNYLTGYDGPEVIYNFSTPKGQHEEFQLNGREVEPFSLYELKAEEKL